MARRKQDAAPWIDGETPHPAGDATGESQLAWGIENKKHAFTEAVALAVRPQANPLRDSQILAGSGSTNRVLDAKGDGDRFDGLAVSGETPRNGSDRAGENSARPASDDGEADRYWWRAWRRNGQAGRERVKSERFSHSGRTRHG